MDEIVDNFNDVAIQMLTELKKIIPHSLILENVDLIENITKKKKTFLIDNFVMYVLQYKDEINSENEDFFLKHEFTESSTSDGIIKMINEIKDMWKGLGNDKENKKNIFGYFQVLCYYSEKYFIIIDSQA